MTQSLGIRTSAAKRLAARSRPEAKCPLAPGAVEPAGPGPVEIVVTDLVPEGEMTALWAVPSIEADDGSAVLKHEHGGQVVRPVLNDAVDRLERHQHCRVGARAFESERGADLGGEALRARRHRAF